MHSTQFQNFQVAAVLAHTRLICGTVAQHHFNNQSSTVAKWTNVPLSLLEKQQFAMAWPCSLSFRSLHLDERLQDVTANFTLTRDRYEKGNTFKSPFSSNFFQAISLLHRSLSFATTDRKIFFHENTAQDYVFLACAVASFPEQNTQACSGRLSQHPASTRRAWPCPTNYRRTLSPEIVPWPVWVPDRKSVV